jgi:hypothetical protein
MANLTNMFTILEKLPPDAWGRKSEILRKDQNRDWVSTILRALGQQGYVLRLGRDQYRTACRQRDLSNSLLMAGALLSSGVFEHMRKKGISYEEGLEAEGIPAFKPSPEEEGEIFEPLEPEVVPKDVGARSSEGGAKETGDDELRAAIGEILYVVQNTVPDLIRGVGQLLEVVQEISVKVGRLHSEWFPEKKEEG